jgi:glycosyltransferase involved in cell wall biosynthesis
MIINKSSYLNKVCCIFNLAPHYNEPIYKLIDEELKSDFYIGNEISYPINLMNYSNLEGYKNTLIYAPLFKKFYWQNGVTKLAFQGYQHYIITGEPYCLSTWVLLILCRLRRKKTYLWSHGWYGDENSLKKYIKKIFFGLSNLVLLYGDYAKELMINEGFDRNKLIPVYNSMDFDSQFEVSKNLKKSSIYHNYFQNNLPVLLYVGRIQKRKKIELLIDALNKLGNNKKYYNLILIGTQTEGNDLKELVKQLNLEKQVWFYGACFDENLLGELIYNADLCVVPGDVGLTVMHSFIYGTPVITHNNFSSHGPEFEAIHPGITGDFFIQDSLDDLCEKIIDWTINRNNSRDKIRNNCIEIIKNRYNPKIQIDILKKVIFK